MNEISQVIGNGYCVGCGACASSTASPFVMNFEKGKYIATLNGDEGIADGICPFVSTSKDESQLGNELFSSQMGIRSDRHLGYYLKNYAGYVKVNGYRIRGSSGGFGSWIASKLLDLKLVDKVIHVKSSSDGNGVLFKYQISESVESVNEGAKSKYYPIEMSDVMAAVRNNPGKYLFIGVPCFIKAVRLLAQHDPVIGDRIKFTLGLVCGHLKSDYFAKAMGWQMGIIPSRLRKFDFRVKLDGERASNYGVMATGCDGESEVVKTRDLFVTSWGYGFFKLKACDFCDDVLAETADITIGDAWLPEYVKDGNGTNIITIRNQEILKVIEDCKDELHLDEIDATKIFESQLGGFRHRHEGLQFRLFLKDVQGKWRPKKRLEASDRISKKRQKIYEYREFLAEVSHSAYEKALTSNDFKLFEHQMTPLINHYEQLMKRPLLLRIFGRLKRLVVRK